MSPSDRVLAAATPLELERGWTRIDAESGRSGHPRRSACVRGLKQRRFARFAVLAGLALGGCMDRADQPLSPSLGAAVASMDAQIIDPTPAEGIPEGSGARAAQAIRRYETGKVKPPPGPGYGSVGADAGASGGSGDQGGGAPAQNQGSQK